MADGIPLLQANWPRSAVPKISAPWSPSQGAVSERNLIVIVLDDPPLLHPMHETLYGYDRAGYDFSQQADRTSLTVDPDHLYPYTPRINQLAAEGVTFSEFRAMPVCSPFRASFLTGLYPFRHGVGSVPRKDYGPFEFGDPGFVFPTLPASLEQMGISTAIIGKIHLSIPEDEIFEDDNGNLPGDPTGTGYGVLDDLGFGYYSVWLRNLNQAAGPTAPGSQGDYYWHQYKKQGSALPDELVDVGSTGSTDPADYATKIQIDEALEFINAQSGRFFMYLPLHAVHSPFTDLPPEGEVGTPEYLTAGAWYNQYAMMESVDFQIGRLLDGMDAETRARTTICLVGDNGFDTTYVDARDNLSKDFGPNWNALIQERIDNTGEPQLKASVKCSGVRSIMLWAGTDVATPGRVSDALTNCTDFLPSVMEFFAGASSVAPAPGSEGQSLIPLIETALVTKGTHTRQNSFHEIFRPLGDPPTVLPVPNYESISKLERGFVGLVIGLPAGDPTKEGQFLLTRRGLPSPGVGPAQARSPFGMNNSFATDWNPQHIWTDAFKGSRYWLMQDPDMGGDFDQTIGGSNELVLDANRWPILGAGQAAATLLFWDLDGRYPAGTYEVTWDGDADGGTGVGFDFGGNFYGVTVTASSANAATLDVDPSNGGIFVKINSSLDTDPIRNIQIQMPGQDLANIFHSDYLDALSNFECIRFLDWGRTNDSPSQGGAAVTTFASRPLTSWANVNQRRWEPASGVPPYDYAARWRSYGVPVEYMVNLCNDTASDMWYCMPHEADASYQQGICTVLSGLDTDRTLYVELSNEVWNGDFYQGRKIEELAVANQSGEPWDGDPVFTQRIKYYSRLTAEMIARVSAAMGAWVASGGTVKYVCGAQRGNIFTLRTALDFESLSSLSGVVGAVAPYVGATLGATDYSSTSIADIITILEGELDDLYDVGVTDSLVNHKTECDTRGVQLVCYEGGQHLADGLGGTNNQKFVECNRSSEMKVFLDDYMARYQALRDLATDPAGVMCLFEHITKYEQPPGTYLPTPFGYQEYLGQADSLKWNGLLGSTALPTDQLFHIEDGNGDPVDPFELVPLDVAVEYLEVYTIMAARLDELLASSPPTSGDFRLPITDVAGNPAFVRLNENNRLEFAGITDATVGVNTAGGQLSVTGIDGQPAVVTLEAT